jgi:hypothetical protein
MKLLDLVPGAPVLYVLIAVTSATGAWQVQNWRYGAKDRDRLTAEQELRRNNEKAAAVASTGYEAQRAAEVIRTVTITKEVERVIQSKPDFAAGACFDDDGLRLIRAAASGTTSQPGPTVP